MKLVKLKNGMWVSPNQVAVISEPLSNSQGKSYFWMTGSRDEYFLAQETPDELAKLLMEATKPLMRAYLSERHPSDDALASLEPTK